VTFQGSQCRVVGWESSGAEVIFSTNAGRPLGRERWLNAVAATVRPLPGSDAERTALVEALAGTQENITLTAQELGVSRVTLYRMLRRHSINLSRGLKAPPVVS
jgi:transcriptional regulator of acetoin/glycerol metabolism